MSGEKKRLEQFLLQTRASNIMMVDPTTTSLVNRFQPQNIDRLRLLESQRLAGLVPVTERLKKEQKKKKRKARKGKALRGDLARNLTAQKRFTRGERREKDTEEPRIVGEPAPTPAGFAYDPVIERRRLELEDQRERQRQLERIADRRIEAQRQERELAVRRGELAAGRAERALIRAAPPIVIPPAQVRVEAPQVRVEGPTVNIPQLPARSDADPIPEIQRLGATLRSDYDAFGQEQDARNREVLEGVRQQVEIQERQNRESVEAILERQQAQDENLRRQQTRQDAQNEEFQARLGLGDVSMGRARDSVIQEIRDAEERLRQSQRELDRPESYDDVILGQVPPQPVLRRAPPSDLPVAEQARRVDIEEVSDSPTPSALGGLPPKGGLSPREPGGIAGVIAGGGLLDLPNVVVERPGLIGPDEPLRLSSEESEQGSALSSEQSSLGIPEERLRRGGGRGTGQYSSDDPESSSSTGTSEEGLQFELEQEERLQLDPVQPVNVAEALRLSRLAIDESEPVLRLEEEEEAEDVRTAPSESEARERLVDTQDFMGGFDRPVTPSPRRSPFAPVLGGAQEADVALQTLLDTPPPSPRVEEAVTPSTPEEEQLFAQLREEEEQPVLFQPGQVSQGIAQFGGAAQPAPARVIEPAGIIEEVVDSPPRTQTTFGAREEVGGAEIRPLDPEALFESVEEAEVVGEVLDSGVQRLRDSQSTFRDTIPELSGQVRPGPRASRGQRGGLGYRVRNNTDRTLKKVEPGDVVNITGVEAGGDGKGRYRLDTQTARGTRVGLDQLEPLIDDGSFIFESGHRHELGGHFDEEPYGPEPALPADREAEEAEEGAGYLQQGAEAVGGAVAGVVGGGARLAGGAAQGVAQGLYEQLPAAGDVGAALGRGAVGAVAGAGRLAAGVAGAALGGGEEEEVEEEEEL